MTKGGEAPNIIPAHTVAKYIVRANTLADLDTIKGKVLKYFEAGALATGSELEVLGGEKPYAEMLHDPDIAAAYRRNAEALGRVFPDIDVSLKRAAGSTDMGNVSLAMPSIHPAIGIDSLPADLRLTLYGWMVGEEKGTPRPGITRTAWQKFPSGSACCHSCVGRNPAPGAALDSQSSWE